MHCLFYTTAHRLRCSAFGQRSDANQKQQNQYPFARCRGIYVTYAPYESLRSSSHIVSFASGQLIFK